MADIIGTGTPGDDKPGLRTRNRRAKVRFNTAQRKAISSALRHDLEIDDPEIRGEIVETIARTGAIRTFGYGSLIVRPHTRVDSVSKAQLNGWAKAFVCYDPFYSGTWSEPGLCLGLEQDDAAHTVGAVLENTFDKNGACPEKFTHTVVEHLEKLAVREKPVDEPLYCFRFLDVEFFDGDVHRAIACVADTTSRLYAGNGLTLEERAEIIARSHGVIPAREGRPEYRYSNMEYIRKCIHGNLEMGDAPCEKMVRLLRLANAIRRELDDDLRADLESIESRDYHPSVYL